MTDHIVPRYVPGEQYERGYRTYRTIWDASRDAESRALAALHADKEGE